MDRQITIPKRTPTTIRQAMRNFMVGPDGIAGAALVEFTIFAPMLLVLIIGLTDFGLYVYRMSQVQIAAQAGAQLAIQKGSFDSAAISSVVSNATCYPAASCGAFTATVSASPAPFQFCGCPSNTGVTQIAAGACIGGLICTGDGSVAGTYVTVQAQATYSSTLPSVLSPYPWVVTYSNTPTCPGGANKICAQSTVRIQ